MARALVSVACITASLDSECFLLLGLCWRLPCYICCSCLLVCALDALRSETSLVINMTRSSKQKKRGQWKWMDRAAIEDKYKCVHTTNDLITRKKVRGPVGLERVGSTCLQSARIVADTHVHAVRLTSWATRQVGTLPPTQTSRTTKARPCTSAGTRVWRSTRTRVGALWLST